MKEENSILNKILKNFFPERRFEPEESKSVTYSPIFGKHKVLNKPTVLEFKNHHNFNNKFIIPSFTETQNILKKPTRYSEENKFDIFKHFGSVSELKDIEKEDPTYITRIQGLHN